MCCCEFARLLELRGGALAVFILRGVQHELGAVAFKGLLIAWHDVDTAGNGARSLPRCS